MDDRADPAALEPAAGGGSAPSGAGTEADARPERPVSPQPAAAPFVSGKEEPSRQPALPPDAPLGTATRAYAGLIAARTRHAAARIAGRLGGAVRRRGSAQSGEETRRRKRRFAPVLAVLGLGALAALAYVGYCVATLPIDGGLQPEAARSALVLEADNGETFATRGVFKGERLTADDLPPHLVQAIMAIEDRRFYQHRGLDLRGVCTRYRPKRAGRRDT